MTDHTAPLPELALSEAQIGALQQHPGDWDRQDKEWMCNTALAAHAYKAAWIRQGDALDNWRNRAEEAEAARDEAQNTWLTNVENFEAEFSRRLAAALAGAREECACIAETVPVPCSGDSSVMEANARADIAAAIRDHQSLGR